MSFSFLQTVSQSLSKETNHILKLVCATSTFIVNVKVFHPKSDELLLWRVSKVLWIKKSSLSNLHVLFFFLIYSLFPVTNTFSVPRFSLSGINKVYLIFLSLRELKMEGFSMSRTFCRELLNLHLVSLVCFLLSLGTLNKQLF